MSFGTGLNTAALGEPNHHLVPDEIRIRKGGVVNFMVAGFHQIFVYLPGTRPRDVLDNAPDFPGAGVTPDNLFINYGFPIDPMNPILYYAGINPGFPAGPPGTPALPPQLRCGVPKRRRCRRTPQPATLALAARAALVLT